MLHMLFHVPKLLAKSLLKILSIGMTLIKMNDLQNHINIHKEEMKKVCDQKPGFN